MAWSLATELMRSSLDFGVEYPMATRRIIYMDSMRSILMILGIVIHASNVFDNKQDWLIFSEQSTEIAHYLGEFITTFRMPAFFVISGFFCNIKIEGANLLIFLSAKLKRILLPLIATTLTLNSLQTYILVYSGYYQYDFGQYIASGDWISHLWFLNNLLIYFVLATLFVWLFNPIIRLTGEILSCLFLSLPMVLVLFIVSSSVIFNYYLIYIEFPIFHKFFGIISLYSLLNYLPYFLFGILLRSNEQLLYKFSHVNPIVALLLITGSTVIIETVTISNENYNSCFKAYFLSVISWTSVSLVFFLFNKYFNLPSKIWDLLADSSYTVYLFHHIIIICIALFLIELQLSPIFSMISIILLSFVITLFIHVFVISKNKYIRLIFNGK